MGSILLFFLQFFFFFRLFPSGVATAYFPSTVGPIFCILLRHFNRFNLSHALFHHVHKPPFWPSSFPLSWQLHPQHPIAFTYFLIGYFRLGPTPIYLFVYCTPTPCLSIVYSTPTKWYFLGWAHSFWAATEILFWGCSNTKSWDLLILLDLFCIKENRVKLLCVPGTACSVFSTVQPSLHRHFVVPILYPFVNFFSSNICITLL